MEVQAQRTARRFRASARPRGATGCGCGGGASASSPVKAEVVGANYEVAFTQSRLQNRVPPNSVVDARIDLNNTGTAGFVDPNFCTTGELDPTAIDGLSWRVQLFVNGQLVDSEVNCVPDGGGTRTYGLEWTTPDVETATDFTVEYVARLDREAEATEQVHATLTRSVMVEAGAPADEPPTDNGNGNGNGDGPDLATIALLGLLAFGGAVAVSQG